MVQEGERLHEFIKANRIKMDFEWFCMAMGPSICCLPVEKAVTSTLRYKSLEVYLILLAFITSCGTLCATEYSI